MKKIWIAFFCCLVSVDLPGETTGPALAAESAIAVDADTREIIYARDIDRKMYPASLTKLLTAILLAEYKQPGDTLVYSAAAKAVYPFKLDLDTGEKMSAAAAMDAILLFSANDIAWMVAENVSGDVAAFGTAMNLKAAELGLQYTHFITPSGLHNAGHFSTAYDLSIILRELYQYPWILESMGKIQNTIVTSRDRQIEIRNRNKLLGTAGCTGGKTGWTPEAGRCLAALFERKGRRIAGVVLKSEYDRDDTVVFYDMVNLMDWAYREKKKVLLEEGDTVRSIDLTYKVIPLLGPEKQLDLPVLVREPVAAYTADPDYRVRIDLGEISAWELRPDRSIGEFVLQGREIEYRYPLFPGLSAGDLFRENLLLYGLTLTLVVVVAAGMILLPYLAGHRRANPPAAPAE